MIAEPRRAVRGAGVDDADVAGADEPSAALQERRATAGGEVIAVSVAIRAGYFLRAADADFISAIRSLAALSPVDEEIIKMVVPRQAGRLDGLAPRELVNGGMATHAQAGLRVQLC